MKLSIYGHGGSANHGNEAIVRGMRQLFSDEDITLYSFWPENDRKFGLERVCEVKPAAARIERYSFKHISMRLFEKIFNDRRLRYRYLFKDFLRSIKPDNLYILEAGDQYCENNNHRAMYAYLNQKINEFGGKTVMLGCTINEEHLKQESVIQDLKKYSLIITRESLTYNALINAGITKNTKFAPDPAFCMQSEPGELPPIFRRGDVVGINTGFLKQGNERYYQSLIDNCITLIKYILSDTEYNIALIPHVNWSDELSDLATLKMIKNKFRESARIEIIPENNAPRQKFIMANCRFMVALRTHVSIPSIAAQVPTLVTGYKVKSTGIVRDIFPPDMKLLAHVQSLEKATEFVDSFIWMQENEGKIRKYMEKAVPVYINKAELIKTEILNL